ncbi:MAG: tryptophanase [Deltaproteobacteria bacterium]|nr:tryptophanase [Deltaproteobacteria bacterium]
MSSEFHPQTIIEPFKIKTVEPLYLRTRKQRGEALKKAKFNLFKLDSQDVLIDLLTDSGTSAMSAAQWAEILKGDEAYAGSESFQFFEKTIRDLTGYKCILPTHQGRAAERLLFSALAAQNTQKKKLKIPSNSHFDTTRANLESLGFEGLDFPCEEFFDSQSDFRFKGNMDLQKLENFLKQTPRDQIAVGFCTITNNSCGGQPVSFENIKKVAELYRKFKVPFYLDACRFAENSAFIQKFEMPSETPESIAKKIFALADGATFSAKKDALVNIGGFLATNDQNITEDLTSLLILSEGFPTYGGLAGRDLAAIAQGLKEILDPSYLDYRLAVTQYIGKKLDELKIPYLRPAGGHAIYLDAKKFCEHLKWNHYPGQALVLALYLEGGIRSCEIGSVMFGRQADGSEKAHAAELVRLAIPRRVYTQSHMDYVLEVLAFVFAKRHEISAVSILKEPKQLRHFSSEFSWSML